MGAELPVFVGTVNERGQLDFAPAVRGLMRAHLLRMKPGAPVEVTLKRWRQKRSSQANRYYFGVVVPLIAEHCGYDKQEMHELLADAVPADRGRPDYRCPAAKVHAGHRER